MARSYSELMGLEFEAERLVRSGESRAEASRRLGVHPQTLATWALRGGWRKKDLDHERSREATLQTLHAIRRGNRAADAQKAQREQLAAKLREVVELLAEGSDKALGRLGRLLSGGATPQRLETPKVALGPDPKMGHMKSLGGVDIDRPRDPVITDIGEEWTPELQRRMNREMQMGQLRPARRKKDDGDDA